ncbi:MAG: pyrimidine utilization protein D [Neorhizobium sp.]|nr:pyrimidine utilization protein D [Neorhizobium sp.]
MHFDIHGLDAPDAPTIILSSGLGGSAAYWAPQLAALTGSYRVITYDHRGTGRTGGTVPYGGGIAAMADDVMDIAATLDLKHFDFMGHALGGLIGLHLALKHPDMIGKLVLINAWSKADPHSGRCFDTRIELLEKSGVEAFIKAQPLFLYPAQWMADHAERMAADDKHGVAHFQGRDNILKRIAALRAFDIDDRLAAIRAPTLVIATKDDLLVPYGRSEHLAKHLPKAELALLDHGAHAVNVTEPERFNGLMTSFLGNHA